MASDAGRPTCAAALRGQRAIVDAARAADHPPPREKNPVECACRAKLAQVAKRTHGAQPHSATASTPRGRTSLRDERDDGTGVQGLDGSGAGGAAGLGGGTSVAIRVFSSPSLKVIPPGVPLTNACCFVRQSAPPAFVPSTNWTLR